MSKFEEKILGMKSSTKFFGLLVLLVWGVVEVKAQTLSLPYEQTFNSHPQWQSDFINSYEWLFLPNYIYTRTQSNQLTTHPINVQPNAIVTINWDYQITNKQSIVTFRYSVDGGLNWVPQNLTHGPTGNNEWRTQSLEFQVGNNSQIQFEWSINQPLYRIDNINISEVVIYRYFNKENSNLSEPSNWNSLPDGTGDVLSTFNNSGIELFIVNGTENYSNEWNIPISNNRVVIDEEAKLTILGTYSGPELEVNNGILQINTTYPPPISNSLSENAYIVYGGDNQTIGQCYYPNIEITGTGLKTAEGYLSCNSLYLNSGSLEIPQFLLVEDVLVVTSGKLKGGSESSLYFYGSYLDLDFSTNDQILNYLFADNAEIHIKSNLNIDEVDFGGSNIIISENMTLSLDNDVVLSIDNQIDNIGFLEILGNLSVSSPGGLSSNFSNINNLIVSETSTITYNAASGSQNITELPAPGYANLTLSGNATKETGASNIIIRGTFTRADGNLNIGTSTFTFSGGTRTLPNVTFHNLTMSNGAIANLGSNLNIEGNLTLSSGGTLNGGARTINIAGNWENNEGVFDAGTSNVFFNGTSAQSISGNTTFNNVVFSNTGMKTLNDNPSFSLITINNGATVDAGSSTLTLTGNFTNNGTFIPGTGTVVFNQNTTLLPASAEYTFNHINIAGTLTPSSVMHIGGNWSRTGTFNHNNHKVSFIGAQEQHIPNNTNFYDLEVNKTGSSLILDGPVEVLNVLKLQSGIFNTNNYLTLVSTPDLTARIDKVEIGSTLIGEVNIQRTIARNKIGYYYLGTSIKGQTLKSWMDDFWVQGVDTKYPNAFKNVSTYDEETRSWVPVASENEPLVSGVGYKILMYTSNFTTGSMTFDNKGLPVIGDGGDESITSENESFEFNLSYTDSEENAELTGFNFLSNPYPSDINWNEAGWETNQIDESLYIWDGENFVYKTLLFDGTGDTEIEKIASGQGFFVRATGPDASLHITESAKTGGATFFRKKAPENVIKLSLVDPTGRKDNTYIRLHEEGTTDFDIGLDAYKLKGDLNIFTKNEQGHHHAINTSALIKKDTTINIYTTVSQAGTYNINLSGLNSFKDETQIWMKDNLLDKTLLVGDDFQYSFTISNEDKNKEINRFDLIFNRSRVALAGIISDRDGSALPQATISLYQNDELISKVTSDENGKYTFHVAPHQSYQLFAEFHGNNMIQVEDMYTLVKSLNTQLPDPNTDQFVAFDLDNSDQIDQHDLKVLVDAYLGIQQLQNSHQLISTNGNNKFFEIMPDTDIDDLSFVAIPKGQLHDDPFTFSNDSLLLDIEQLKDPNNDLLEVNFVFDNQNILAYQLKLKWDPAKITFRDISSADLQFTVNDETGELFLFNYSKTIPTLYFDILAIGEEINILVLAESNALNADFAMVGFSPRKKNVLGNSDHQLSLFKVSPVYPNPVRESGTIAFFIPEPDEVSFVIHDVNGVIIEEFRRAYPQGENQLHWINGKNLKSGVYLYKIIYKNEVRIQKLVIQ